MRPTLGVLALLRALSESLLTTEQLLDVLEDELGVRKNERTLRRYLAVLKGAGFGLRRHGRHYELLDSPVKLPLTNHEALATLTVVESLAEREPVYGEHLASAALKLREALSQEAVGFADGGRVEFDLSFANDPPEKPEVMELTHLTTFRAVAKALSFTRGALQLGYTQSRVTDQTKTLKRRAYRDRSMPAAMAAIR